MRFTFHYRMHGWATTNYAVQRTRTACGRRLDWIRRNNFLVLGAVRSGTTLLVDYLNCSRQVRCYGEILGPGHYQFGDAYGMSPDRLRLHVESYFVKRPGRFVGAKIMTFHLDELPLDVGQVSDLLHRPKIIVLYRENILEQFVSLKLGERFGVWHVEKPKDVPPIRVDPDEFLAFAQRERRMWCENLSALNGQPIHILSYDQLTSRPAAAMRGVFDFLGVGQVPVWSRLVKVSRQSLWQKVSNFEHCVERGIPAAAMLRLPLADDRQSPFSKLAGATTGPRPRPVSAMAG